MKWQSAVYWNRGQSRPVNEDSLVCISALTRRGRVVMAAVCDGMGGHAAGEWVSGLLIEELVNWFYDFFLRALQKKKPAYIIRRSIERKVFQIDEICKETAGKKEISMGSTLSLLVLWEKQFFLWQLGDSRIYRIRRKHIRQLTEDHVTEQHRLTKCVGSFGFYKPDFLHGKVRKGDAFLLCTDGFWQRTDKKELRAVLSERRDGRREAPAQEERMERRLKELGEAALRRGEEDNLSAIYIASL